MDDLYVIIGQWIESLDHYVSTGAPMTLSAERTIGLRNLLLAVQEGIDEDDAPMDEQAWRTAGDVEISEREREDDRAGSPTGIGTIYD